MRVVLVVDRMAPEPVHDLARQTEDAFAKAADAETVEALKKQLADALTRLTALENK